MSPDEDKQISLKETQIKEARKSWMNLFIESPKIAWLITIFIFLVGIMALIQIPKEASPVIDFGIVNVTTVDVGASAFDMDQLVTQELENKIKDVDGINKITSSSGNGVSNISIELDPETNVGEAMNDIRAAVDTAKGNLPSEADDPVITKVEGGIEPIFDINLVGDVHPVLLRDYAEELKTFLEFDPNVKEINISGGAEREIFVDLDPARLQQFGLSAVDVSNAIRNSHFDSPIGDLTIDDLEYTLRIAGRHQTAEDIRSVVLAARRGVSGTSIVTVADLATVYESDKKTDTFVRIANKADRNARAAVKLQVIKVGNIDIFKADPAIKEKTLKFVKEHFDDTVDVYFTMELVTKTSDSYKTVVRSAIQSTLMVIVLLILFLRVREGLLASLVIPLSFLITIATTNSMGNTLNFMVNFSMILALGILVDITVVIMEGIYDGIKKGYTPKEAAELALYEFKIPLISGQLTTLAVFIPLLTLPGILGKYLSYIPISVFLTLFGALLVSLLLIPGITATILQTQADDAKRKKSWLSQKFDHYYAWRDRKFGELKEAYRLLIEWLLARRWYRIGSFYLILGLCALTFLLPVKFTMFPADDFDFFFVNVELPVGTVKEQTLVATRPVEDILLAQKEVKLLQTSITNNSARILVEMFKVKERENLGMRTSIQIAEDLRKEFKIFQNYDVRIDELEKGPPVAAPVTFRVIAEDASRLQAAKKVASDFKVLLREIPGSDNVRDDVEDVPGEMTYRIDREAALRLGVDPTVISTIARSAIDGVRSATITRGEREVDIRVQIDPTTVHDFSDFDSIQIPNRAGNFISLSQVLIPKFRSALSKIRRVNRQIAISVTSDLTKDGNALEITQAMQAAINKYDLPAGISVQDAGETAENQKVLIALGSGFVIAVILIFSILVVQFNSFALPAIILFTIVMSLLGVNLGLFLTGIPRSLAFIIGIISLAGIVVNDAIILVDRINKLRQYHEDKYGLAQVIAHAGSSRLQPIVLTTLTTAAGIGPLIWVDSFWAGLSVTIIFGLMVASILTLFVTPVMYLQIAHEGRVTFAPLGILVGAGMLIAGSFTLNPVLIGVGLTLAAIFGWIFRKGYQQMTRRSSKVMMTGD